MVDVDSDVSIAVGVLVAVGVAVAVGALVGVDDGVKVGVGVGVLLDVGVLLGIGVSAGVGITVGVKVGKTGQSRMVLVKWGEWVTDELTVSTCPLAAPLGPSTVPHQLLMASMMLPATWRMA